MPEINYLDGAEGQFGLPATLPPGLGEQATMIVNTFLKRPEGLVYETDANGNPCHMPAMTPSLTFTIAGGVPAGANVTVTVSPAIVRQDHVGEVLILDRGEPELREAVVVSAISGNSQMTFSNVQFTHAAGVKADVGCVITEERQVPSKRSIARYTKFPCVCFLSLMGRYAYGRRSDQVAGLYQEMNLLAAVQTFGGPPQWLPIPVSQASWSDQTGEVWVPAGLLLAYYSDVKMKYVAGFPTVPDEVVRATAQIANAINQSNATGGPMMRMANAGTMRFERFSATFIDEDVRRALEPLKARMLF